MPDAFPTRYPGYDALANWSSPDWDDPTREAVRKRIEEVPPIRFFDEREAALLRAVVERILPQPDRAEGERVPIVPWIDEKLYEDRGEGYRYETLPPQREAWRRFLAGLDEAARTGCGAAFVALDGDAQDVVLRQAADGEASAEASAEAWAGVDVERFFSSVLCETVARTYYAHPLAWSEIGYGGPSSPRGHVRKWEGGVDPWEPEETDTPRTDRPRTEDR